MDESQGEEGADPQGMTTPGTEQLQSNLDYSSSDESSSEGTSEGSTGSSDCTPDHTKASGFDGVLRSIHELWESQRQLEERFERIRATYQQDYSFILEAHEEEQNRGDYLEERLTDATELYQNDVWNLNEELATKEQKMAERYYDTIQDFNEGLQTCETRVFKLEQQQQEETTQPERWTNTIRHLLGKLMNVTLAIMAVLLELMSTVAGFVVLFVKTSRRTLCTLLFLILLSFLWRHQEVILDQG